MKQFLFTLLLAAQTLAAAHGQAIDTREILRRGNLVEAIPAPTAHAQAGHDPALLAALAPPADDSHKWFITILTLDGCGPCQKLRADWQTSPQLAAFAVWPPRAASPRDAKSSWAHLNIYAAEDQTQTWRWKDIAIRSYPTILVQPPRSGAYGDPATVVLQKSGYNGNAAQLAGQLRAAIRTHLAKQQPASRAKAEPLVNGEGKAPAEPLVNGEGEAPAEPLTPTSFEQRTPPFAPPAPPTPNLPPLEPSPLPVIPPSVDPDTQPSPQVPAPAEPVPAQPAPPVLPAPANEKPPADQKYPQHPEAVVIVDKYADSVGNDAAFAQIRQVLARLRADRPGLLVRLLDVRDAKQYPVEPRELPAVITTSEGRLETKLDRTLLPLVAAEPPPFPWQALVGLLTTGFNWAGAAALAVWAVAMVRARRKAQGARLLLDDALLLRVRALVEELVRERKSP